MVYNVTVKKKGNTDGIKRTVIVIREVILMVYSYI